MTKEQFILNETKAKEKLSIALSRYNSALKSYNEYDGNNYAEENRLSIMWKNADAKRLTAQKELDKLQKDYIHFLQPTTA